MFGFGHFLVTKKLWLPVRLLHVVLCDLVGLGVHVDRDLSLGAHKPAGTAKTLNSIGISAWGLMNLPEQPRH